MANRPTATISCLPVSLNSNELELQAAIIDCP